MFRKMISGILIVSAFVFLSEVFAGDVKLTTYYPAPGGQYRTLRSTEKTCFATASGNVGIGTAAPRNIAANDGGTGGHKADLDITGSIVQEAWTEAGNGLPLVLNAGYYNVDPAERASFFRDRNGIVHLRGRVGRTAAALNGNIFRLPEGYRPAFQEVHAVQSAALPGAVDNTSGFGRCDIQTTGFVEAVTGEALGWMSLDGITFQAAGYEGA